MFHNFSAGNWSKSPNILDIRRVTLFFITEEIKFESITPEVVKKEKSFVKLSKKHQKELETLRKKQQKERTMVQKTQCAAIEKLVKCKGK